MKVHIGPYKSWFGPYQLAELLCFWAKPVKDEYGFPTRPDWVHNFGEWLAHGSVLPEPQVGEPSRGMRDDRPNTWLYRFLLWIDSKRSRKLQVRLDRWDTWGMDETLGYIILPMLKQLKVTKHGSPFVDDEDVPEHLRSTSAPPKENEWDTDDNHHRRWEWVLDEMIFAFETKVGVYKDWEDQFHTGTYDFAFIKQEDGNYRMTRGPNDTAHFDKEGAAEFQKRITNGFRLFGRYYEGLWD
jgi:hypothetical protein